MNQILNPHGSNSYYKKEKKVTYGKAGTKLEIKEVLRVFAITIILFGMMLIGKSVYSMVSNIEKKHDNVEVTVDRMGKEVTVTVETGMPIKQFMYRWDNGEETVINGNETNKVSKTIEMPNGSTILNVTVIDYYDYKTYYQKQYMNLSSDVVKPEIEISIVGSRLKLTAKDETKMAYMLYKWEDQEEVRIDVSEDNPKEIIQEVEVPKGDSTLTVIAYDADLNKTIRTQATKGSTKPTIELSTDGKIIKVKATDEEGIDKITIIVDDVSQDTGDTPINKKEVIGEFEVATGNHNIRVIVKNMSGLEEIKELSASI